MTPDEPLVLVVEDDEQIRKFLRTTFESHNFRFAEASTAREGMAQITTQNPHVIILDLGLPDGDGLTMTRELRQWSKVPVIVLSARGQEQDKIAALDAGADDFVSKPFAAGELLARVRVALRHLAQRSEPEVAAFTVGDLRIDLALHRVTRGEEEIHLTPTEFKLIAFLAKHAGKVLTHRVLLTEIWGKAYENEVQYLRVYAAQLRRKIERNPAEPEYLLTEPGVGYRLGS